MSEDKGLLAYIFHPDRTHPNASGRRKARRERKQMTNPNISAAAATEAAASVRDAFQPGEYPSVQDAYEFIRQFWADNDDPRWRRLPVTPNHSFSAVYLGLIAL